MKKILIVDDDQDLLRGLSVRLKANHYDVVFATDAMYAVSNARKEHPDLIILDIGLPGGDGFLVMDRLKSNSALAMIPIIILSARDPQANRERSLEHGAEAFLQKPADNFVLMQTIQRVLGDEESSEHKQVEKMWDETENEKSNKSENIISNKEAKSDTSQFTSESKSIAPSGIAAPDLGGYPGPPAGTSQPSLQEQFKDKKKTASFPFEGKVDAVPRDPKKAVENKKKSKAKSILVVDDDHDLLLGMSVRLMAYGYNVFFTYDVITAIAKAKKVLPDLIILDIGLPGGGDGFTVMKRMKKIPELAQIPVIILTALEPDENRAKAKEMGAVAFFQKPANNNDLISVIRKIL